jgi:Arc/MetJ-type ribon-helix-helix transcriptional regulator
MGTLARPVFHGVTAMPLQVSTELAATIEEEMATGKYDSEEQLLREALLALREQREDFAAIQAGIDDWQAGRTRPISEVAADIRERFGWKSQP